MRCNFESILAQVVLLFLSHDCIDLWHLNFTLSCKRTFGLLFNQMHERVLPGIPKAGTMALCRICATDVLVCIVVFMNFRKLPVWRMEIYCFFGNYHYLFSLTFLLCCWAWP